MTVVAHRPAVRGVAVGTDGSDASLPAVELAAAEADLRGLPLRLLSANPAATPRPDVKALVRRLRAAWPGLAATAHSVTGEPAQVLVRASRTAALLVVGRRDDAGPPRPGAVCAQVAAHALCPTVVVPPDAPVAAGGPVLLGLEMSPVDEPAIGYAFEEAALRRAPLLAIYVWSGIPVVAVGTVSPFTYDLYATQAAADRVLAEALAPWADKHPEVAVDRLSLYDANPAGSLLEAGATAGLLVVSARLHAGHHRSPLGNVARTLIGHATGPVAVVRGRRDQWPWWGRSPAGKG
jgi:nucleotide-binding universal stress UspA family protein